MTRRMVLIAAMAIMVCGCKAKEDVGYYFNSPASIWEETVPLGNGRIGMMPWGGVTHDEIVLNEITMWSGSVQETDNPESGQYLATIRDLLFQGKEKEAQDLVYKTFTCLGRGSAGGEFGNYQIFANLCMDFTYPFSLDTTVRDYRRDLNMSKGLASVSFVKNGVDYFREYITSMTEDVGVVKLTASGKSNLSFQLRFKRDSKYSTYAEASCLVIKGNLSDGITTDGGMAYSGAVMVINDGGTVQVTDSCITVTGADNAQIFLDMATNYDISKMEIDKAINPEQKVLTSLANSQSKPYKEIRSKHEKAFSQLFDRVELRLPKNESSSLPIDQRLAAFEKDDSDADLVALYMQYGRYLLISSTRKGSLPPNLQGLWAHQIHTPWNGDYHFNINLQMNHWPAEVGNLSELHIPLMEYTRSLVPHGEKTAKVYYDSDGWVTHIQGNLWGFTSPSQDPSWGATNTGGAWLCRHIWDHYLFTQDIDFLAEYLPVIRGAAAFFSDMLVTDPRTGYLLTAPTTSPENAYFDEEGNVVSVCAGSTMDNQLVRELFTNFIQATQVLGITDTLCNRLSFQLPQLAPTIIGSEGQIMEWNKDYREVEPHHRHVSHLFGLYPGNELTYSKTPELMEAARVTLERRGDQSTGWSMAWKINFWARLKDGERAFKLLKDLLHPAGKGQGTYPNLFSAHPPMQIDGNFGGAAGIMEMLVQSHEGEVEFLPAIPTSWTEGYCRGLCVRGGKEVEFKWKNGELVNSRIY